ncbi:unnamed protein product [Eruca vesicaria subsp. sativa]|uniref:Uncharacterized protein n=1 Tax=Eruca vesicaria subsp. sativa TaxID=29727 RepID=A0ABC8KEP0_ERUVS|nr:unnamed protein product [Eruca vesicaria subsp. sativa]
MSPTLRSVVSQAWRSIGSSRRNFSSSRGSSDGEHGFIAFAERNITPEKISFRAHVFGYVLYCAIERWLIYKIDTEKADHARREIDVEATANEKKKRRAAALLEIDVDAIVNDKKKCCSCCCSCVK